MSFLRVSSRRVFFLDLTLFLFPIVSTRYIRIARISHHYLYRYMRFYPHCLIVSLLLSSSAIVSSVSVLFYAPLCPSSIIISSLSARISWVFLGYLNLTYTDSLSLLGLFPHSYLTSSYHGTITL